GERGCVSAPSKLSQRRRQIGSTLQHNPIQLRQRFVPPFRRILQPAFALDPTRADVERQDVEFLDSRIALQNLLPELHADGETVGMLAQRRVKQEYGVIGERPAGFDFELRSNASVKISWPAVALLARDRLKLSASRQPGEHDRAFCLRVFPS